MAALTEQQLDAFEKQAATLLESFMSGFSPLSLQNGYARSIPNNYMAANLFPIVPGAMSNYRRGEVVAAYRNEGGLRFIRDVSRYVCMQNEYAIGAIENRISFIVGNGYQYPCSLKKDTAPPSLVSKTQDVISRFIDDNEWGDYEQELQKRGDRDGEWFLRFFPRPEGRMQVRVIEPEFVTAPKEHYSDPTFTYGVEVAPNDVGGWPVAFWVMRDPASGRPERIDASEILHAKFNVDRNSKRGLPLLFSVTENLERAEKTLRNFSVMAQLIATYAVIRKHKQGGAAAVDTFRRSQITDTGNDPYTGVEINAQQRLPGSIIDTSDMTDYEFPGSQVNVEGYVRTLQADLRALGCRLVMPEFMISGDSSNANYGAASMAEAPGVRKFLRDQSTNIRLFGTRRGPSPAVMQRVLQHAVNDGVLPKEALELVDVSPIAPNLVVKNPLQETERNEKLFTSGLLSKPTWAAREGLDFDHEGKQGAGDNGLGLQNYTECLATGKTGPCAQNLGDEVTNPTYSKLGVTSWPVADKPAFLDGVNADGKTYREEWQERFKLADARPEGEHFRDPERIQLEQSVADALKVPTGDVLFDSASGATLFIGVKGDKQGRRGAIAVVKGQGSGKYRGLRLNLTGRKHIAIDLPDDPDERRVVLQKLAKQKADTSRYDAKYSKLTQLLNQEDVT